MIGLIYNNLIYICFQGFSQLLLVFTINFMDRINISFTFLFLFFSIFLSLTFYSFVFIYNKKKLTLFLLAKSPNRLSIVGFNLIVFLRFVLSGLIHSYFFSRYDVQIVSLLCVKIAILLMIIFLKKKYRLFFFISDLGYFLSGLIYDTVLLLNCEALISTFGKL